ncbi:unnamed protein product [Penicillium palitans]
MNSSNSYDEEPITPLTLPGALVDCHRQETILLSAEKLRVSSVPGVYIAARFPEDAVVIVKELEENKYIISPNSPPLLFECQTLYNTRGLDFSLAQVYVAMMKMSRKHTLEGQIGDWLRFMMRKCLCSTELNQGDEGPFIRVALALQRRVKGTHPESQGIEFGTSPPYCKRQNGLAERTNHTIRKRMNTLLSDAILCPSWWIELVDAVVNLKLRAQPSILQKKTPFEILIRKAALAVAPATHWLPCLGIDLERASSETRTQVIRVPIARVL